MRKRKKLTAAQKRKIFSELGREDPKFADRLAPFLKGLYDHYFRCETTGWENVPNRTCVFVGNHNGLLTFEVVMLFYAWWKQFGWSRRALGLAHDIALKNPAFSWLIPKLGAIPADPDLAFEALQRDYSLLVFPGGEKESFRPYKERKKVDFYQRKGFIRLALRAKAPIVPIVSIGAHESYVILNRGEELAERLGLKERMRLHGMPITIRGIFFMWCMVTGVFTFFPLLIAPAAFLSIFIPLPTKMTFRILPPIDVVSLWEKGQSQGLTEDENLQLIYDQVVGTIQETLTAEYAKRRFPVIG